MNMSLLNVEQLSVRFKGQDSDVVDGISFSIGTQQTVGLVGESGSGKSISALSLMRLAPPEAQISGKITWKNQDILSLTEPDIRAIRGAEMGMIFQNPLAALNPVYSIADHFIETLMKHKKLSKKEALENAISLLASVRISAPEKRIHDYPHQFSLGMCQRVMIALTLAMSPTLLIADEPTASLDVTVQAQILDLLNELKSEQQMSMLLISHDLGVISQHCDWVLVMYQGQLVEQGTPAQLFATPQHPYTQALIDAIPKLGHQRRAGIVHAEVDTPIQPQGCRFAHRCPIVQDRCRVEKPPVTKSAPTEVRCWGV